MGVVIEKWSGRLMRWGTVVSALAYILLHVLLLAALIIFGQRAGGYPLQEVTVGVYGVITLVGLGLAVWRATRRRMFVHQLLPLILLAPLLAIALAGAFFATEALAGFGLRTTFMPYLDDDSAFAWINIALATWLVALALAARWRALLVGGMGAQGLALLLNPGLLLVSLRYGLYADGYALLILPALYLAAILALGWRPRLVHLAAVVVLLVGGVLLAALFALGIFLDLRVAIERQPTMAAALPRQLLLTGAFYAFVLGLPFFAWRLRPWSRSGRPPMPLVATGIGLALLVGITALSWRYLGPGSGAGDSFLPQEGQTMGWIGKTVPMGAYGPPGDVLLDLKPLYLWILSATGFVWLARILGSAWRLGFGGGMRWVGFPGGLAALGFAMLFQGLPAVFMLAYPLPIQSFAGALPMVLGQRGLSSMLVLFGYPLLGLGLLGCSASLPDAASRSRRWLTFAAPLLALVATVILSAGLVAGTLQNLELQRQLSLPEFRQAAQLRLLLSLPVNAVMAFLGWVVLAAGLRRLTSSEGADALSRSALLRGASVAAAVSAMAALAFWQLTAMPIAETSPPDGTANVPTNAPIIVRLTPGDRNWGPGMRATYADTGELIQGSSGGTRQGETWFNPREGWRPNARVEVQVCCGHFTRSYRFSFTTAGAPSPDVTPIPAKPAPASTALRPGGPPTRPAPSPPVDLSSGPR